jgi:cation diffusion facilitator CzcD-associated flavoprotein CzcO
MTAEERSAPRRLDIVIVGAGVAGLYAVYKFRDLGFSVRAFEAADGVGGTWRWNRYPGARCDVPSLEYSYSFSPEVEQEWEWTEFFPSQPEIERYLNHVADRFDLRRDIQFRTTVTAATYDDDSGEWLVDTDDGGQWVAQFVVMATGCLSIPTRPDIDGLDSFEGRILQTSRWPDGTDLTGARIALIGTGSSGVQATPELAAVAEQLYVFQRTATYTWPSRNRPMDPAVQADVKARYRELREVQRSSYGGLSGFDGVPIFDLPRPDYAILDATDDELEAALEEWGFGACRVWNDIATNAEADARASELYREMVRRTVRDPETAEALSPRGYPIFCKRPVLDVGYFETFNRDNVSLVDLRKDPIESITPTGIRTVHDHFDVDVIVFATGFDAMTGALLRVDIRGAGGRSLHDDWKAGPRALLGLQVAGYPNLFTVTGPGSPSVLANMMPGVEQHVEWIAECLAHLRDRGLRTIEATMEAQDAWMEEVNTVAQFTLYVAPTCNSWYLGANIPGKPRVFMPYVGGFQRYIEECDKVVAAGYEGFITA